VTGVPNHDLKPSTHHPRKDPSEKEKKEKSKAEKSFFSKCITSLDVLEGAQ